MNLPVLSFQCHEPAVRRGVGLHCDRCEHDLVGWRDLTATDKNAVTTRARVHGERICVDVAVEPAADDGWDDLVG